MRSQVSSYLTLRCSRGDLHLLPRPLEPRKPRGLDEEPLLVEHDLHGSKQPRHGSSGDGGDRRVNGLFSLTRLQTRPAYYERFVTADSLNKKVTGTLVSGLFLLHLTYVIFLDRFPHAPPPTMCSDIIHS